MHGLGVRYSRSKSNSTFATALSTGTLDLFHLWNSDHPLLCGNNNKALFGSCLASTGKSLEIQLGFTGPVNPGLTFSLSVWKVDFYNQTFASDYSTILKIRTVLSGNLNSGSAGLSMAAVVSGEAVFQMLGGHATVDVAVQPYVAEIAAGSRLIQLAGEAFVYAEGFDDESTIMLRYVSL